MSNPNSTTSKPMTQEIVQFYRDNTYYEGALPKSFERYRHLLVTFSDERKLDQGYWLYLRSGLCWDSEVHFVHENTVAECIEAMKNVYACYCNECISLRQEGNEG